MTPGPRGILKYDLFNLPFLRWAKRFWRIPLLAGPAPRREALAVLYEELAVSLERGVPLDTALELIGRPAWNLPNWPRPTRPLSLLRLFGWLFLIALMLPLLPILSIVFVLLAPRMVNVPAIASGLARHLMPRVRKGFSLSEAMRSRPLDFESSEVEILESAEQAGHLPFALRQLATAQLTRHRLLTEGAGIMYPAFLISMLAVVSTFIFWKILPRFVDIFEQLGAELPGLTTAVIGALEGREVSLLLNLFLVVISFIILSGLMNGTWISRLLIAVAVYPPVVGIIFAFLRLSAEIAIAPSTSLSESDEAALNVLLGVGALFNALVVLPFALQLVEAFVLSVHRRVFSVLRYVPLLGTAARAQRDARWVSALSLGLASGRAAHEAVESAGRIARGGLANPSRRAARLLESGHSLAQACSRHNLPNAQAASLIAWHSSSPDFLASLSMISEDTTQKAAETTERTTRATGVVLHVLTAIAVALFTLSIYMPLFSIPQVVINSAN